VIVHARPRSARADLALVGIAFIWGSTFLVVKEALAGVSTLLFLALRFLTAAVALAIAFRPLPSKFGAGRQIFRIGGLASLLLFAGFILQTVGLRYTTASKSAFITGLSIVLVPLFSALVEKKPPHLSEWLGVGVATTGLGLMTLNAGALDVNRGDLITFFCAFAFAGHIVMMGHYSPRLGFQAFTLVQIAFAAVFALGTFWWVETPRIQWTPMLFFAIAATGILATALAISVQAWAQQYTSATRTALIFALEPVFAWVTSFLVIGELLSRRATFGASLILLGIVLVEVKPISFQRHPQD
jgi:drug/metabolite transporter (DMT)-like permease